MDIGKYGKHAYAIILYIFEHKEVNITQLKNIVKNSQTYTRTIEKLQEDGIVKSRNYVHNRRYVLISLTDKGKKIAELLMSTDHIAEGKTRICPYCNTENDMDAVYCKHCGARLE